MINEGHIVGNHSYRHLNMTQVDLETASDEITMMHDYMAQMFQYEMKYFRFPEGAFSEQTIALAADLDTAAYFGALLMPIGTKTNSQTKKRLTTASFLPHMTAKSCCCTPFQAQMPIFWGPL